MAIRIPLIQVNGQLKELPVGDKISTEVIQNFEFTQATPETEWIIEHNLDKFPAITILKDDGVQIYGGVFYNSLNTVTLSFSQPITGKAFLS